MNFFMKSVGGGSVSPSQAIANTYSTRVVADGGTVESLSCVSSVVNEFLNVDVWDRASIAFFPSGAKASKVYNVKPTNNDLVFTRSGTKTRVNSSGVQESVLSNYPALDFYNSTCPGITIEPARTNLFLNSETLATQSITVTAAAHAISFTGTGSITLSGAHTATITGTGANERVSLVFTPSAGTLTCTVSGSVKYANAELGAFATSWIPTTGATATRNADAISDITGISSLIGLTEGALYLDFETSTDSGVKQVSLSDGTPNNRITLACTGTAFSASVTTAGVSQASISTTLAPNTRYRGILTYRPNRIVFTVNGVKIGEDTTATIPACTAVSFRRNSGASNNPFYGKIYGFAVFNDAVLLPEAERLTDITANASTFNIDTDFDTLNLESTNLAGTDLGAEISLNTYSIFIVAKANAVPTSRNILLGGTSAGDFISMEEEATQTRLLKVSNTASGGVERDFRLWGEEYYQVIVIRRNTTTIYPQVNGRELITLNAASSSAVTKIGHIGKAANGSNAFNGIIRSVRIHSTYLSNDDTEKIVDDLFTKYNLPEQSNAIIGFGDSITYGSNASNRLTTAWLPVLAASLGRPYKNFGISGSTLTGTTGDGGIARYSRQIIERPYSDDICIVYGTNDVTGAVTAQTYQYALENIVRGLQLAGYANSKIHLATIPYRQGDADAALVAEYNTVITNVCTEFGLDAPSDIYTAMKNGGGDTLMNDTVHPNNTGHALIASTFQTSF